MESKQQIPQSSYIEAPSEPSTFEKDKKEIAVQADGDDFDMEKKQSSLPPRKRYIPLKFSDYRIFAGDDEKEDKDESFEPEKVANREKPSKVPSGRGRGRPRKTLATPDDEKSGSRMDSSPKTYVTKVSSGFKCGVCGRIFSLRGNAKAHLITHTDDKPYACDFKGCGKQLRTKESLRKHQLSHLGIKMFQCSKCEQKFCSNASLQEHMARHTGEKPLTCKVCGRKFRQACVLKRHMSTHSQDKPFSCTECGRQFSLKLYLQSHMKTHTGEKPFSCDICYKKFAYASDVNRHKITHTGDKPYPCSVCGKRYGDISSRRRHEKKNHEGPQLTCPVCQQQFARVRLLRTHLVKEHGTHAVTYEVNTQSSEVNAVSQSEHPPGEVRMPPGWTYKLVPHQSQENVFNLELSQTDQDSELAGSASLVHPLPLSFLQGHSSLAVMGPVEGLPFVHTSENGLIAASSCQTVPPDLAATGCIQIIVNEAVLNSSAIANEGYTKPSNSTTDKERNNLKQTKDVLSKSEVTNLSNNSSVSLTAVSNILLPPGNTNVPLTSTPGEHVTTAVSSKTDITADCNMSSSTENLSSEGDKMTSDKDQSISSTRSNNIEARSTNGNGKSLLLPKSVTSETSLPNLDANLVFTVINDSAKSVLSDSNSGKEDENMHKTDIDRSVESSEISNDMVIDSGKDNNENVSGSSQCGLIISDGSQNFSEGGQSVIDSGQNVVNEQYVSDSTDNDLWISLSQSDYVYHPDLTSQDYFNWLSAFAQECKGCIMPLDKEQFTKISHVQKILSDFMATPTGVICDKSNFKILMKITQDLSEVINKHLAFMFESLD